MENVGTKTVNQLFEHLTKMVRPVIGKQVARGQEYEAVAPLIAKYLVSIGLELDRYVIRWQRDYDESPIKGHEVFNYDLVIKDGVVTAVSFGVIIPFDKSRTFTTYLQTVSSYGEKEKIEIF